MKIAIIFALFAVSYCLATPISSTHTPLLRHEETHTDDKYDVEFELGDGTHVKEHAERAEGPEGEVYFKRVGSYKYISPEGEEIEVHYTADENGFRAEGNHLPTANIKLH